LHRTRRLVREHNATYGSEPLVKCSSTDVSAVDRPFGGSQLNRRDEIHGTFPPPLFAAMLETLRVPLTAVVAPVEVSIAGLVDNPDSAAGLLNDPVMRSRRPEMTALRSPRPSTDCCFETVPEKDEHVRIGMHRPPLLRALAKGKCADVTVMIVPEANHAYTTGPLYEKGEMLPGVIEAMAAWILERCGPG